MLIIGSRRWQTVVVVDALKALGQHAPEEPTETQLSVPCFITARFVDAILHLSETSFSSTETRPD